MADSKFLKAESLLELVKAVMWASGPVMRIAASGERSDIAEVLPAQPAGPAAACCTRLACLRKACPAGWPCTSLLYTSRLPAQGLHALDPRQCGRQSVYTTEVSLYALTQV